MGGTKLQNTAELKRLVAHRERKANWKKWGPYLSERAWGTVREDYSDFGTAWDFFPTTMHEAERIAGTKTAWGA